MSADSVFGDFGGRGGGFHHIVWLPCDAETKRWIISGSITKTESQAGWAAKGSVLVLQGCTYSVTLQWWRENKASTWQSFPGRIVTLHAFTWLYVHVEKAEADLISSEKFDQEGKTYVDTKRQTFFLVVAQLGGSLFFGKQLVLSSEFQGCPSRGILIALVVI